MSPKDRDGVIQSTRFLIRTLRINEEVLNDANEVVLVSKKHKRAKTDENCIDDIMKSFNGTINTSTDDDKQDDDYDEIKRYMKNNISYSKSTSILTWWKNHMCLSEVSCSKAYLYVPFLELTMENSCFVFSRLSRLAIAVLAIPASSATAERVFSETGRILEARRQQLAPETLDGPVFLRNY